MAHESRDPLVLGLRGHLPLTQTGCDLPGRFTQRIQKCGGTPLDNSFG
jgi:hypothetical protein